MEPITAPSAPTSVYLYYDRSRILIYVGVTSRGIKRNREHNETKDWWQHVAKQEVEHFDTRMEALARERALIEAHCPPFNVQHNRAHAEIRAAYMMFCATSAADEDPLELMRERSKRLVLDVHGFGDLDHMAFRTRITDAPLTAILRITQGAEAPKVYGMPAKRGTATRVGRMERHGPIVTFHMATKRLHPVGQVEAHLKYDLKDKVIYVTAIQATMDHTDTSWCDRRCPQNRQPRVRWVRPDGEGAA